MSYARTRAALVCYKESLYTDALSRDYACYTKAQINDMIAALI